ncbi:MAG: hypothetical protein CME69_06815 [Halobacteriovorax sp.]|nr:hypothetical protein [Halobacteriovorax sp.]|tara:strand:+ start:1559 stop:2545 length:987 start_codon:yes stop_codon:yes gene_type:complete
MAISSYDQMVNVLKMESQAITRVIDFLDKDNCKRLEELFLELVKDKGQLVFCGVGKSGLVGEKLASTFSSLGLPSIFLHPTEALHGDLGRVTASDGIVFISKSGNTSEILKLLPFIPVKKQRRVALVGNTTAEIAKVSDIVFDCSVEKEACINDLAPTTSSSVAIAMGDAMAVVFESLVGLSKEGFARNHPGGLLGKSLLMKVEDLMQARLECPILKKEDSLKDAILEMTNKPVGACAILEGNTLKGIIVEGDIRRSIVKSDNALSMHLKDVMTENPVIVSSQTLALDALSLMESNGKQIYVLPVVDKGEFKGFIRMHDLLKEGFSNR